MGAYLSSPVTDKNSFDKSCVGFTYGASSMQGWRIKQEDAHNCISDLDEKTALFAVYDGHGGSEVAEYCAKHLPDCVKESEHYKDGDLGAALTDAFLKIDSTLVEEDVIKELKLLAGDDENDDEDEDDDPDGRGEADELKAEASVPLEEVLAKYKNACESTAVKNLQKKDHFQSPVLRGKRGTAGEDAGPSSPCGTSVRDAGSNQQSVPSSAAESSETGLVLTNGMVDSSEACSKELPKEDAGSAGVSSLPDSAGDGTSSAGCSASTSLKVSPAGGCGDSAETSPEAGCSKGAVCEAGGSSSAVEPSGSNEGCSSSESQSVEGPSGSSRSSKASQKGQNKEVATEDDDDDDDEEDGEDDEWEDMSGEEDEEDSEEEGMDEGDEMVAMDMSNEEPGSDSGCTACVALLRGDQLVVANAGDSRCVLCRAGRAVELSFDHKPEDDAEKSRIEQAGGKVTMDGRVNGGLNLSRAIGDHFYKRAENLPPEKQMITALPDLQSISLEPEDQFFIVACDGIWNSMTSQEAVDFVAERLKDPAKKSKPSLICEELFDHCLAPSTYGDGTGCDNMTAIIVVFDSGHEHCAMRSKRCVSDLSPLEESCEKRPRVDEVGKAEEEMKELEGEVKEVSVKVSAVEESEVTGSGVSLEETKVVL